MMSAPKSPRLALAVALLLIGGSTLAQQSRCSDTDGAGTFPANSYDLSSEYSRSALDIRHRFVLIGNFRAPWGLSFSPMIIFASGAPFNITIGRDLNGDTLFSERPAFATNLTKPGVVITRWGALLLWPFWPLHVSAATIGAR